MLPRVSDGHMTWRRHVLTFWEVSASPKNQLPVPGERSARTLASVKRDANLWRLISAFLGLPVGLQAEALALVSDC